MTGLASLSSSGAYHCHDVTVVAINIGTHEIPEASITFRNFSLGGRSGHLWRGSIRRGEAVTMAIETGAVVPTIEGVMDVSIRRDGISAPERHEVPFRSLESDSWVFLIVDDSRMTVADSLGGRPVNVSRTEFGRMFHQIARLVGCWWQ